MNLDSPPFDQATEEILNTARQHAGQSLGQTAGLEHLALALISSDEPRAAHVFSGLPQASVIALRVSIINIIARDSIIRLLSIYARRLFERGIALHVAAGVADWLLGLAEWRESSRPIWTVRRLVDSHLSEKIEKLLSKADAKAGEITLSITSTDGAEELEVAVTKWRLLP